jgi:ferredoxin
LTVPALHRDEGVRVLAGVGTVPATEWLRGSGPDDLILEAASACPTVAISAVDNETGDTVFP